MATIAPLPANTDQPAQKPAGKVVVHSGNKLAAFVPQTLEEAWKLSGALAASGMTPKAYGSDQNKVMVGILAGAEVGLTPFAALQSIAVIGNNPSLWGDGALALVQASGLLEDMEETDDGKKATCRLNRKDRVTPIVRHFSMDDAQKAGLAGKTGPWTQYPARMRQMRARAFALRDGFSDVLKGLHIVEEVRDYAPMDGGTLNNRGGAVTGQALLEQAREDEPAANASEGPDDSQRGEQFNANADEDARVEQFIGFLATKTTVIDVNSLGSDWADEIAAWSDDNRGRAAEAQAARVVELKAQK